MGSGQAGGCWGLDGCLQSPRFLLQGALGGSWCLLEAAAAEAAYYMHFREAFRPRAPWELPLCAFVGFRGSCPLKHKINKSGDHGFTV